MSYVHAAVSTELIARLEASLDACRGARARETDEAVALDVCLDSVFVALGAVAKLYTESWTGLAIPWFDHRFDWLRGPSWWPWYERGIAAMEHIAPGSEVLDLCCGDGFYAGVFYGRVAALVHGLDRNEQAIALARRCYQKKRVQFFCQDVRDKWPQLRYDVVTCFGAIEHLSVGDGEALLKRVAQTLPRVGVFVGSTVLVDEALRSLPGRGNPEHDNEFESVKQLRDCLAVWFETVDIWTSFWGSRTDIYFRCSV